MADYKQQQQDQQPALQHLAHLRQDSDHLQVALEPQLQPQAALVAVQDLERQRLQPQHLAVNPLDQLKVSQHYKGT